MFSRCSALARPTACSRFAVSSVSVPPRGIDLNQTDLPDPVARALEQLVERIHSLEAEVESLKKSVKEASGT